MTAIRLVSAKVDFTIPHDLKERLERAIAPGLRSNFVAGAIRQKLDDAEREKLRAELREGYVATRQENEELSAEWEQATLEGWPK